jgi:16S rRNA processing protein RimM
VNYIQVGKIVSTFGIVGQVIITHALGKKLALKKGDVLFVENIKNSYVPYFVSTCKAISDNESHIGFEDIVTKEKAKPLVQKNIWVSDDNFNKWVGKTSAIGLLHFMVYENDKALGLVNEVIEQPHQVLLKIDFKNNEAFIPLHAESLINIDRKAKKIMVTLPEGLLAIYSS